MNRSTDRAIIITHIPTGGGWQVQYWTGEDWSFDFNAALAYRASVALDRAEGFGGAKVAVHRLVESIGLEIS